MYTIEQLHFFIDEDYYSELLKEAAIQQERLNAFVRINKKLEYKKSDSILAGIPYVLKDNFCTKGLLTTASSRMLEDFVPPYSAHVYEQLTKHGAILLGKSSMDELGMGGTNKTALTGPVYNPWDVSRIAGGSSGGSAVLVAAGLVPFALGTDTGDSVRRPAGYCGIVGFKPSWGRISRYGVIPYASSLDTVGIFSRNVRDASIVLECIAGRDDRDMTSSFKEVPHYLNHLDDDRSNLKIAIIDTINDEIRNDALRRCFDDVVDQCKKLDLRVDTISIDKTLLRCLIPSYTIIANCEATSNHACLDGIKYGHRADSDSIEDLMIKSRTEGFSSPIKRRYVLGGLALSTENQEKMFRKAQKVRRVIVDEVNRILNDYDIILTPNSGGIAPKIEDANDDRLSDEYIILENHLIMSNFAGTPSLTLPCGFVEGMPVAVNLMGRLFEEQTVLNVANALENVLGFKNQYSSR